MVKFMPTFKFWKVGFLGFWANLGRGCRIIRTIFGFLPTFSGLLATFENGSGHEKPSNHAGLRVKSPLAHFYSLLIVIKSLSIYKDMGKISGHLTKRYFYLNLFQNYSMINVRNFENRKEK